jgi:hypothetical protein
MEWEWGLVSGGGSPEEAGFKCALVVWQCLRLEPGCSMGFAY